MKSTSKILFIKKCILLLLLLVCGITVISQRDRFYEEREYYALNFFEDSYNLLTKDFSSADQIFVAKQEELNSVYIKFDITNLVNLNGTIQVSVLDSNDDIVASKMKNLSHLTQTESTQWTQFPMNTTLEKGELYTLHITVQKFSDDIDGSLSLLLASNKQGLFKDLQLDGKPSGKRMVATFKYNTYCMDDLALMLLLLLLAGVITLAYGYRIPGKIYRRIRRLVLKKTGKKLRPPRVHLSRINWGLFLMILTPLVADYMMQSFCGYSIGDFFEQILSLAGVFNFLIYVAALLLFYLLTGSSRFSSLATMILTYGTGLANYYVWSFRDCPIVAADLSSIRTAANVAAGYDYSLGFYGSWGTVILLVWATLLLVVKPAKRCHWKRRIAIGLVGATMTLGLWGLIFKSDYLGKHDVFVSIWMPQRNYAQNGCALSFFLTCSYYVVQKPADYGEDSIDAITNRYESDSATSLSLDQAPNVIAIMNESLSDLAVAAEIGTSEDYMPFIHNLTENTIKGNLHVSVLGGNTANTEMEFLTGNSMAFFPSRSVPYNTYLRNLTSSLTWSLRNSGYESIHAVHPYYSNGWSREIVYPLLGFTDFISRDQFENPKYVREFISDESSFDKLIEEYEALRETSDAPFYDFNVTMQNHGGYAGTHGLIEEKLQVQKPANPNDQLIQYMNLMKESDIAFENLLHYFEKVDEPTIIVMFGDHQPGFTDSVYDELMGQDTDTLNTADTSRMYITPYIIWANYDLDEAIADAGLPGTPGMDMSPNYLSSYLLKLIGAPLTGYNKYLLDLMEKVPVISAICYIGDDGEIHTPDEESQYSDLLNEYQILQYNNMFDTDHRSDDFFFLKDSDLTEWEFEHTSAPPG